MNNSNNIAGVHGLPFGLDISQYQHPQPRVMKSNNDPQVVNSAVQYYGDFGGCGWWRMNMPETLINYNKKGIITGLHKLIPQEEFYSGIKSVKLQRQASPIHAEFIKYMKDVIAGKHNFKIIY